MADPKGYLLIDKGEVKFVEHPKKLTLEELQALVGGFIQAVPQTPPGITIFVDEEGRLKELPFTAQALWLPPGYDVLCGPVLVLGRAGVGNPPITEKKARTVLERLRVFDKL